MDSDEDKLIDDDILRRQTIHAEYERQQALIEEQADAAEGRKQPARRRVSYSFQAELDDDTAHDGDDADVAQLLMDAVPMASKTPAKSNTDKQEKSIDLWADCDRGVSAQKRLTGTHVSWS